MVCVSPDSNVSNDIYFITPQDKCKNKCIKPKFLHCDMLHYLHLFLEAGIDDAQVLTLTREDLNELFPGICNFQLRRTIMSLITDTVKVMSSVKKLVLSFSGPQIYLDTPKCRNFIVLFLL